MFCMFCGQSLPDVAKFCFICGKPQDEISPTEIKNKGTINLDGTHTFVPAMCPNCGAQMKVDSSTKIAHCNFCDTECLVQDAIKALNVKGNVHVGNATINVNGTNTDSLLQRVEIMLMDGDFEGAMKKCDTILDSDPTNGYVYLYLLLCSLKCRNRSDLANQVVPFDGNQYYVKALQYGDDRLKSELAGYTNAIGSRMSLRVGDEFYFGTFNSKPITWKILAINNGMAYIISSENVCFMPYQQAGGITTWSKCSLRWWLNYDFLNTSFSPIEINRILPFIMNDISQEISADDKVSLLSTREAGLYFGNNQARANGTWWWLRSKGYRSDGAARVRPDGAIYIYGRSANSINAEPYGVRPTMWIRLFC